MRDVGLPCLKWCDISWSQNVSLEGLPLFLDVKAFPLLEKIEANSLRPGTYNIKQKRELVKAFRERGVRLRMTQR